MSRIKGWRGNSFMLGRVPIFKIVRKPLRRGYDVFLKRMVSWSDDGKIRYKTTKIGYFRTIKEANEAIRDLKKDITRNYRKYLG